MAKWADLDVKCTLNDMQANLDIKYAALRSLRS